LWRYAEVIGTKPRRLKEPDKDTALSLMGESRGMALLLRLPRLALGRGEC